MTGDPLSKLINPHSDSSIINNQALLKKAAIKPIKKISREFESKSTSSVKKVSKVINKINVAGEKSKASTSDDLISTIIAKSDENSQHSSNKIISSIEALSGLIRSGTTSTLRQTEEIFARKAEQQDAQNKKDQLLTIKERSVYQNALLLQQKATSELKNSVISRAAEEKDINTRFEKLLLGIGNSINKLTPSLRKTIEDIDRKNRGNTQTDNIYRSSFDVTKTETRTDTLMRKMFGEKGQFSGWMGMFEDWTKKDSGLTKVDEYKKYKKGEKTDIAITTVIPNILSEILGTLRKAETQYYDWETKRFATKKQMESLDSKRLGSKRLNIEDELEAKAGGLAKWRDTALLKYLQSNEKRNEILQLKIQSEALKSDEAKGKYGDNNNFGAMIGSKLNKFGKDRYNTQDMIYFLNVKQYFPSVDIDFIKKAFESEATEAQALEKILEEYKKKSGTMAGMYKSNMLDRQDFRNININDKDNMEALSKRLDAGVNSIAELELIKRNF